ncbi:MAG TPA: GYD domain-containing protein [Xanthobacteraceae bacterium]|nr:GYD domain-containing protein [Xanthobacteraceae bacterium]
MPKYLVEASYTAEGLKGLQKDKASGREKALRQAVKAAGGKVDSFYFALGEHDVVTVVDVPDISSVAALCIAASGTGLVRTRTTALLTVDEADAALEKQTAYRGPGK